MDMRVLILFTFLFALIQCAPKEGDNPAVSSAPPTVESGFKSQYDNCIQIITMRQVECKKVDCAPSYWDAVYAFQCLHALTGVESNIIVNSEDPYFYPTTESKDFTEFYYEDLIRWNDWYEKNKLTMTLSKADSLLKIRSEKVGYEIKWPQPYTMLFSSNPSSPSAQPVGAIRETGSN
jgi:hypothetical protein